MPRTALNMFKFACSEKEACEETRLDNMHNDEIRTFSFHFGHETHLWIYGSRGLLVRRWMTDTQTYSPA